MVVLLLSAVVVAGALVLLVELVSTRAADAGRTGSAGAEAGDAALPLVAARGARFGDATLVQRSAARRRMRVVPAVSSGVSSGVASPAASGRAA